MSSIWNNLSFKNYYPFSAIDTTTLIGTLDTGAVILISLSVKLTAFYCNAPYLTVTLQYPSY
jgi:hypothetical protein